MAHMPIYDMFFITGMSGAGKTLALKILNDKGYHEIDNLPLHFIDNLIAEDQKNLIAKRALGFGGKINAEDVKSFCYIIEKLRSRSDIRLCLVYLDAIDDVLINRYALTGLSHPFGGENTLENHLRMERAMHVPLLECAGLKLDTSLLHPRQLMSIIGDIVSHEVSAKPHILISSFGFKFGTPRGSEIIFDARLLKNPHWDINLRDLTGQHPDVAAYIEEDEKTAPFLAQITAYLKFAIIDMPQAGKNFYSIGIGCTGGKHRSVYLAEKIKDFFAMHQYDCHIFHKSLSYDDTESISDNDDLLRKQL
ncbi:MAG: RNase adapter RapZ [Pseudomonadota bacterium]